MALFEEYVGRCSEPVENPVERVAVRRFAEAIGDPNPVYTDPEAARRSVHGGLIAPPTFPRTFEYGSVPGAELPLEGLIHGGHNTVYERPLYVGESVVCRVELKRSFDREGRSGRLGFLVFERTGETPEGERIFTSDDTVVVTEQVRERLAR
ncbi:MaoC family dehydratase N-terminal domain-containing protein [Rubrobacter aplysinae]|uniref:MaoC family dehydratase N-terminal domain-containing protein n=1 Tax=Rubrobacter aplysinae TaxID=909625 RepID=UPI00064C2DF3|nr:MaoC family dehydratase N-terminal domain-containing protein [Rubrobacter aplysinae]